VRFQSFVILQVAVLVLFVSALHAEQLDHHGMQADSEGTAAYCLTCHDGLAAKKVVVCTTTCTVSAHKFLAKYPPPGREKDFATQQAVQAAGIRLENGMVTCISCHDLKNLERFHFAIDSTPFARKLCYTCHVRID
jgi:hypothetical protein